MTPTRVTFTGFDPLDEGAENPAESSHDFVGGLHSDTALCEACGLPKAHLSHDRDVFDPESEDQETFLPRWELDPRMRQFRSQDAEPASEDGDADTRLPERRSIGRDQHVDRFMGLEFTDGMARPLQQSTWLTGQELAKVRRLEEEKSEARAKQLEGYRPMSYEAVMARAAERRKRGVTVREPEA